MIRIKDPSEKKSTFILLYGPHGSGKTSIGSEHKNSILLDADDGIHRTEFRRGIVADITKYDDISKIEPSDLEPFLYVSIDTLGAIVEKCVEKVITLDTKFVISSTGQPSQAAWGVVRSMCSRFLDVLMLSGSNVLFLCHEKQTAIPGRSGDYKVSPYLGGGSFGEIVCRKCDMIGHIFVDGDFPSIDFRRSDSKETKDSASIGLFRIESMGKSPQVAENLFGIVLERISENSKRVSRSAEIKLDIDSVLDSKMDISEFNDAYLRYKRGEEPFSMMKSYAKNRFKEISDLRKFTFDKDSKKFIDSDSAKEVKGSAKESGNAEQANGSKKAILTVLAHTMIGDLKKKERYFEAFGKRKIFSEFCAGILSKSAEQVMDECSEDTIKDIFRAIELIYGLLLENEEKIRSFDSNNKSGCLFEKALAMYGNDLFSFCSSDEFA